VKTYTLHLWGEFIKHTEKLKRALLFLFRNRAIFWKKKGI